MNLVLIGMRGSGKTTVSKLLSKKVKKEFLELDKRLEQKTKMPIGDVVKKYGWDYFRDKESEVAEEVSKLSNKIISTGGGVVTRASNIKALKKHGLFIYLNTPIDNLLQRVNVDAKRPRLTDKESPVEEMKELLRQREHLYKKTADIIVNTGDLSPKEIADKILQELKRLKT